MSRKNLISWNGMGEKSNTYMLLVRISEGKSPLRRPRRRWRDYIKTSLGEVGWGGMDWVILPKDKEKWRGLVNAMMNHPVL
jgi:hypothetical protein